MIAALYPARKRTWLYLIGEPVALDWSDPDGYGVVGAGIHTGQAAGRPRVEGSSTTPDSFRAVLLDMARSAVQVAA